MTVFAVQEVSHLNFSDAERFGEIHFLSKHDVMADRRNGTLNSDIIANLKGMIQQNYDVEEDFLLLCGDPILIGIAMHEVLTARKAYGTIKPVKILKYDRVRSGYSIIEL